MARTFRHILEACGTLELSVNGAEAWVIQTILARFGARLVHRFGVHDMRNTHILDLFGREKTKLDLLYRLERRIGMREMKIRHI
jgi:hypothetical protein